MNRMCGRVLPFRHSQTTGVAVPQAAAISLSVRRDLTMRVEMSMLPIYTR